jgi:hypothetical protein
MIEPNAEQQAFSEISAYVDLLLDDELTDELNRSEDKRRAFFAFMFGGIAGLALQDGLSPPQAHAIAVRVFHEGLCLSADDSAGMALLGIEAASGASALSVTCDEGMRDFLAWRSNPDTFSTERFRAVLERISTSA